MFFVLPLFLSRITHIEHLKLHWWVDPQHNVVVFCSEQELETNCLIALILHAIRRRLQVDIVQIRIPVFSPSSYSKSN